MLSSQRSVPETVVGHRVEPAVYAEPQARRDAEQEPADQVVRLVPGNHHADPGAGYDDHHRRRRPGVVQR